jgi:hypothetical protein
MTTSRQDRPWFRYGAAVRVKHGLARKPWEWIGTIQLVSGDVASVAWRVILPGTDGSRPVSCRSLDELEPVEASLPGGRELMIGA